MRFLTLCYTILLVLRVTSQHATAAESAAGLEVAPTAVVLNGPRDRVQLVVSAKIGDTLCDVTREIQWQAHEGTCASVDSQGVVRATADGSTQLVGAIGDASINIPVTVTGTAQPGPVSFRLEVLPILTKAGCNSGKCHGSPSGKGGFAISLRGFDLQKDYQRLTREAAARRIDFLRPAESLLIAKPALQVPHGGGRRFRKTDPLAQRLIEWIAQGAPHNADDPAPVALEIFPSERWLEARVESQQLRVVARLADGSSRDVTHLAHYSASPEGQAEVAAEGLVRRLADGEVTVAAVFGDQFATSRLAFLRPADGFVWASPPENNQIDHIVFDRLRRLRIAPSELCDDATFLRRAWLDVCGLLPPPDEVRRFLADASIDKRERQIDELLEKPQYADFWAMKWADRLGCNQRFVGKTGAIKYHAWIRHQIAANVGEDEFARRLLTASGGSNPAAHPELLDWLAANFAAHGFDRKYLIRQILRSRVYQLAPATNSTNAADDRYFSHAAVRLLCAEQLLDAIAQATGAPEKFSGFPLGLRAVELPDGEYQHRFLAAFGRPARALACACERDSESNLGQALELIGGEAIEAQLRSPAGHVTRLLSGGKASDAIVEEMFLATLCRPPTAMERAELVARLDSAFKRSPADHRAVAEDIMWALLNHQEFLFQH